MSEGNGGQIARAAGTGEQIAAGPMAPRNDRIIDVPMKEQRSLATVTAEIRAYQDAARRMAIQYSIEIGRRLIEAKEMVNHGEWGNYLREELGFSQSTANNHMAMFRAYAADQMRLDGDNLKNQAFGNLTYTQALALLALPSEEEREAFVESHDLAAMSTRELREELRRRNETEGEEPDSSPAFDPYPSPADDPELLKDRLDAAEEEARVVGERYDQAIEEIKAQNIRQSNLEDQLRTAQAKQTAAEVQAQETLRQLTQAKQDLAAAKTAEKDAKQKLRAAEKDPKIPKATMDKLRQEAREAAEKSLEADRAGLDQLQQRADAAEAEAAAAKAEADRLAKELRAATPELAVFRERFGRVQKDLAELIDGVDELPDEKRSGIRKGLRTVLQQAMDRIGETADKSE